MSINERLIQVTDALKEIGLRFLIMGGHAVRFYGVDRNTVDFDFHVHADEAPSLTQRLNQTRLFLSTSLVEGPSWRKTDFRRYQIGVLPNGKEEWLEFWFRGHLLAPFQELYHRHESGTIEGKTLPFLALSDLIRSKETEREDDWLDVALLEEILDNRNLALASNPQTKANALSVIRSRRGFERAELMGLFRDSKIISSSLALARNPITVAYLSPFSPHFQASLLEPTIRTALSEVAPASPRHLALVEAVRLAYKRAARAADHADKQKAIAPE